MLPWRPDRELKIPDRKLKIPGSAQQGSDRFAAND